MDTIKRVNLLFGGRATPGIVDLSTVTYGTVEVPSKDPTRLGALVRLPVSRADVVSIRETNPANGKVRKYLTITNENINPRFAVPRKDAIVGLDFDEKGDAISLDQLIEMVTESTLAYQRERLAASAEPEVALG